MPTTKKYGYTFGGWYFDNDTFEKPFYVGSSTIDENTTLYAKWVLKTVKVYLDTFYEDEFEPLIYNVGDTFHLSSLPEVVKNKKTNGLSFSFKNWVRGDEKEVVDDFVLEDEYYEFHATYGSLDYTSYKKAMRLVLIHLVFISIQKIVGQEANSLFQKLELVKERLIKVSS